MKSANVTLEVLRDDDNLFDDDAESNCLKITEDIHRHLIDSPFIFSAEVVLFVGAFQVKEKEEIVAMKLYGVINDQSFQQEWSYASGGFGMNHSISVLHPGHWLIAGVARLLVHGSRKTSVRSASLNQIVAGSSVAFIEAIDQFAGSPPTEVAAVVKLIALRMWFVYGIGLILYATLFLLIELGNPANPVARHNNDGPVLKTLAGLMVGGLAGFLPMCAYFFFSAARLPAEQVDRDPAGRKIMALIGVESARTLRLVSDFVSFVAAGAAVAFLYFLSKQIWNLPF